MFLVAKEGNRVAHLLAQLATTQPNTMWIEEATQKKFLPTLIIIPSPLHFI
jgi:hypothetical protein